MLTESGHYQELRHMSNQDDLSKAHTMDLQHHGTEKMIYEKIIDIKE